MASLRQTPGVRQLPIRRHVCTYFLPILSFFMSLALAVGPLLLDIDPSWEALPGRAPPLVPGPAPPGLLLEAKGGGRNISPTPSDGMTS